MFFFKLYLLGPLKLFDKPTSCEDFIDQNSKEKKIFFLTSSSFADETFLKKISSFPQIVQIYLFDSTNSIQLSTNSNEKLKTKMRSQRQILVDLIEFHSNVSIQFEKQRNSSQAKESLQQAMKLFDFIDDKDQQLINLEENLHERLEKLQ